MASPCASIQTALRLLPGDFATTLAPLRVLVVSNMKPDAAAPQRGSFVRDQVAGLRRAGVDVDMLEMPPGWRRYPATLRAIREAKEGKLIRCADEDEMFEKMGIKLGED